MKKLSKDFESAGFKYKQIYREKDYAIYERHHVSSENKHFEAIKIQSHNGYEIAGNKIPPGECYPTSNSWGTQGFTCLNKKAAYDRLDKMMRDDIANKEKAAKKAKK
jgi:hypothetical protein